MHYNKNPLINQICEQFNTDGINLKDLKDNV